MTASPTSFLTGAPGSFGLQDRPLFDRDDCGRIIDAVEAGPWQDAGIYRGGRAPSQDAGVDPDERSVRMAPLPDLDGFPAAPLVTALVELNDAAYRYRLSGWAAWDLPSVLRYEADSADHFREHADAGPFAPTRRLTFTVQLSDPDDYDGGDLVVSSLQEVATRAQGALITFPATALHHVTPVVRGRRYALVGWVHGATW